MQMTRFRHTIAWLTLCLLIAGCKATPPQPEAGYPWITLNGGPPLVIAHRGASGLLPEHTLAAYALAIEQGADFIEPDVVLTRDGIAVCRHDMHLADSTNIEDHPEFADRKRTIGNRTDWFVSDFTLAELQTLRATQVFADRDRSHDGRYAIPTLQQVMELLESTHRTTGRTVGVYIEIKGPAAHRAAGLDPTRAVLDVLDRYPDAKRRLYLQCFERDELNRLAGLTDAPLIYLASNRLDLATLPQGLAGIGLAKGALGTPEDWSAYTMAAHARGLRVHLWTFRDDRLDDTAYSDGAEEIAEYFRAGVDGVFTDFPASGVEALRRIDTD